jgi:hypothetical protein
MQTLIQALGVCIEQDTVGYQTARAEVKPYRLTTHSFHHSACCCVRLYTVQPFQNHVILIAICSPP